MKTGIGKLRSLVSNRVTIWRTRRLRYTKSTNLLNCLLRKCLSLATEATNLYKAQGYNWDLGDICAGSFCLPSTTGFNLGYRF